MLLTAIPFPTPGTAANDISKAAGNVFDSSPSIVVDPIDATKLVVAYTQHGANANSASVVGNYSADGGTTWTPFTMPANLIDAVTQARFQWATDASIAFDRLNNFYISYIEHEPDNSAGAVVLQKFSFSGAAPTPLPAVSDKVLYNWAGADPAFAATLAVDSNLASYADPSTGKKQTDPTVNAGGQGPIYVAWSTNNTAPAQANNFNPNTIRIVASADGGANFSAPMPINDGVNFGADRDTAPRLVVSQGTADGKVKPGQLSIVWDNFGGATADVIAFDRIQDGGKGAQVQGAGGPVADATAGVNGAPDTPVSTTFSTTVSISDPRFILSGLNVAVNLVAADLAQLSIQLVGPGNKTVDLVRNGVDAAGNPTGNGITGANLGIINNLDVGTVFDSQAPRRITDPTAAAPFTAHFQPEAGSLAIFNGLSATQLSGKWSLIITDYRAEQNQPPQNLDSWSLTLTSNLTPGTDTTVATTPVRGAMTAPYPLLIPASPDRGVGPAPAIVSDNTLGSFSPYQGRLYVTYVSNGNNGNTDIGLATSDNGGATWAVSPKPVNDDNPTSDGFSQGDRPQFQPSVAVDQSTGTVVVSFYDARQDAAKSRVAMYVAASIDGAATFQQTFVNTANLVQDAATGQQVNVGPIPDNQSAGDAQRDVTFGFGDHQGLAVAGGTIFPVWAGNLDKLVSTTPPTDHLTIFTNVTKIPAGPRIISSTMGPVSLPGDTLNPPATDGSPLLSAFQVQFDRPIDPQTFTAASVTVIYHDVNTSGNLPGTVCPVSTVTPVGTSAFGATTFQVTLTTPQSGIGTYSYYITPDMSDRIRPPDGKNLTTGNKVDQNSDTVPGTPPSASTLGDVYAIPAPTSNTAFQGGFFAPPFDQNTLPLIVPGPHVVSTHVPGTPTSGDNLALNQPVSSLDVTFDRNMDPTSFTPASILRIMSPFGAVNQPHRYVSADTLTPIPDSPSGTPLISLLSIPDNFRISDLSVQLDITHRRDSDLSALLIAPDGTRIPLFAAVGGVGSNFSNTLLTDTAPATIAASTAPFNSVAGYRPASPLGVLTGKTVGGLWALQITDNVGGLTGTLNGWSIIATPASSEFSITPNPLGTDPDPAHPRTYRVGFPTQQYSGTYTISLASSITDKNGDALDQNLNAGLDKLRDTSPPGTKPDTTPVTSSYSGAPLRIGGPTAGTTTTSTISVTDMHVAAGITVQLDITYPNDSDLRAVLTGPDGTAVGLFTNLGKGGAVGANFESTIFDDLANTPIQNGSAPYFGRFNAQFPLSALITNAAGQSRDVAGTWTLSMIDDAGNTLGTLNNWSLTFAKPLPSTGLGEGVADQVSASFRIFTQDPTNAISHGAWTAVGPASINGGGNSGRVGGLAVDPSDPSGNTVYVAGASGGIWKTTNFLTTTGSPTYVPLTDFGATTGINMGGIAVFGRGGDPNKSIIFGATGEGDTGSPGVGIVRSVDGGATWQLLDSATNVDAAGNPLPSNQRDHALVGTTAFNIIVDPRPTPSGDAIVYVALSHTGNVPNGGIWRSLDSGDHWTQMRKGDATDVVLDPNSFAVDAFGNPISNLQYLYAAFRGEGIFFSPNQGAVWNPLPGGVGDPLIRIPSKPPTSVPVGAPDKNPNGPKGRISLAKPFRTGDPARDLIYEGWLYAMVTGVDSHTDGLYLTKDFGQNWTHVHVPTVPDAKGKPTTGIPSNDYNLPDFDSGGAGDFAQGNYDMTLGIDPTNPNIVYLGGTADDNPSNLIRVDTTGLSDPHAFFVAYDRPDGGQMQNAITDPASPVPTTPPPGAPFDPLLTPYMNFIRDPKNPFVANATVDVQNIGQFANTGAGAKWTIFKFGDTDEHRIVTTVDPLTGHARLIIGDDQGVFTAVDNNGTFDTGIGTAAAASGIRNGNLQITQLYFGASQPSLAIQVASALFYGQAQDDGSPASDPNVLSNGNITWAGPLGDGTGVATDQTGSGTLYQFNWPCCGGDGTNFFQVNGVGRTFGLLQQSNPGNTPDPQWPYVGGFNFAVNPIDGTQIIISSGAGRIFATANQGRVWSVIGDPAALDGTYAPALAYGAPEPNSPPGATNYFLYAGTSGGHIYVTFNGGGANGNTWINLSAGLDGTSVQAIVTNPVRGSHQAYAVTSSGVFRMPNSANGANWVNITGNLQKIQQLPFGNVSQGSPRAAYLTSIQADWRYAIPDNPANPTGPAHPVLYVGGEGGVYRSLDNGQTWSLFPDPIIDGAPAAGGYLPNAHVTDLDLAIGKVDPTNGATTVRNSPDVLLATTYGRGSFAARVAPLVIPGTTAMDPTSDSGISKTDLITNVTQTIFDGLGEQSLFGNTVHITLLDMTDPLNPTIIGTGQTNAAGLFNATVNAGAFLTDGQKTIGIEATDDAGAVGPITKTSFTLDTTPPSVTPQPIAASENAAFTGTVATVTDANPNGTAVIDWGDNTKTSGTITSDGKGGWIVTALPSHTYAEEGSYTVSITVTDAAGNPTTVTTTATVADPSVAASGGKTINATEGTPITNQVVATFTDPAGAEAPGEYSANIDWGDGTASTGAILFDPVKKVFSVAGGHTYTEERSYTITTTIHHDVTDSGTPVTVTSTAAVSDPAVVVTAGAAFSSTEGVAQSPQVLATFTDPSGAESPSTLSDYSADVNWGDGTTSTGTISYDSGVFSVTGGHTYADDGTYAIKITVHHDTAPDASATIAATIHQATITPILSGPAYGLAGGAISFNASVNDASPLDQSAGFAYTINWGDGSSPQVVPAQAGNGSGIPLSHTFAASGMYTVQLTASDRDGESSTTQLSMSVNDSTALSNVVVRPNAAGTGVGLITFAAFYQGAPLPTLTLDKLKLLSNGSTPVSLAGANLSYDPASGTAKLDLSNLALPDGDYQLQVTLAPGVVMPINFTKAGNLGRSAAPVKVLVLGKKKTKIPTLNFGKRKRGSAIAAMDLMLRNVGKTAISINALRRVGKGALSLAMGDSLWTAAIPNTTLAPGQSLTVRVYFTPAKPQTLNASLNFSYGTGRKLTKVTVPIVGTVTR